MGMAKRSGLMARLLKRALVAGAVLYPIAIVVLTLLLRFVGENWWVTSVGLFLPRLPFALPLVLVVPVLVLFGPRKLLWLQLATALLLLCPLMGFSVPTPTFGAGAGPRLRVLSWNVNAGFGGYDKVVQQIDRVSPEIVLLQEILLDPKELVSSLKTRFPNVELSGQFLIASRFPISKVSHPERVEFESRDRSPRFMHYLVDTSLGPIAVYNVHPVSPRGAFYALRGRGLRHEILSGNVLSGSAEGTIQSHAGLRDVQLRTVSELAAVEKVPVIIAGDLNSPELSTIFARHLSGYQDGFKKAGLGFGFTFPEHPRWPRWMRLDRILASDALLFVSFNVREDSPSDHLGVVAELVRKD